MELETAVKHLETMYSLKKKNEPMDSMDIWNYMIDTCKKEPLQYTIFERFMNNRRKFYDALDDVLGWNKENVKELEYIKKVTEEFNKTEKRYEILNEIVGIAAPVSIAFGAVSLIGAYLLNDIPPLYNLMKAVLYCSLGTGVGAAISKVCSKHLDNKAEFIQKDLRIVKLRMEYVDLRAKGTVSSCRLNANIALYKENLKEMLKKTKEDCSQIYFSLLEEQNNLEMLDMNYKAIMNAITDSKKCNSPLLKLEPDSLNIELVHATINLLKSREFKKDAMIEKGTQEDIAVLLEEVGRKIKKKDEGIDTSGYDGWFNP